MAEFQRKIELQSPDDLQYLVSNIRRAANEKIDKDLPPIEGEDEMRERVEQLVHEYINNVLRTSSENMTINGLNPSPELLESILASTSTNPTIEIEEHEPFNTKLFERAKDLARQEEDLIEEIAALRRKVPFQVAENVKKEFKEGLEGDERLLKALEENREHGEADLGVGRLERQDDVEKGWAKGVHGLEGLMRTMPETVARKERAEKAEAYVGQTEKR
ncbi:hypothetical protein QTJ16_002087 [Diplocarpon rosae]|uniref:Kinetochore protein mis14 n=1 Tax=Diplocarpon rosae TaxID=946125 RepID=A0AAD9WH31_9HELO|nr:hypothetical protein QTJ16_002087 [Diplocarpon rosae]PBP23050.1 hypothetical protein BUE80_DR005704 [Diplocarpon rosae]